MLLDKLRNASNSIFWKAFLAIIAISFALGGVATYIVSRTDTSAVKVNGEEISQNLFQQQYDNAYRVASERLGASFSAVADTPEFINGLRTEVLNRLINQELLRQYSDQLKLSVSDERIKQEIVTNPMFQVNGKFDNAAYQQLLRNNNMSADAYAEYLREGLRLTQLQEGLNETEFLLPAQQDEFVKNLFQQRKVRLATLPLAAEVAKQSVSEQEIQDYYNANKAKFLMPETVKVQYLDLTGENVAKSVNISDIEIAQYYQDNKAQFVSQRNNGSNPSRTTHPSCRGVCRNFRNLPRSRVRSYQERTMLRCLFLRFFGQLFPTTQQSSDAAHRFLCEQRKSSAYPNRVGVKPPSQDGLQSWLPNAHDPKTGRIRCHQRP